MEKEFGEMDGSTILNLTTMKSDDSLLKNENIVLISLVH